ncbi:hypothetical protein O6P43_023611 [Quillaja saponaria]|uniref:Uncharacterized protein n=1 Tax=Quillaja saponaria TaxID=32244 RepID=A0AAD7LFT6_QUISA|nr:hypothetical protein O6P43_023611 [Quillaja saponaria]
MEGHDDEDLELCVKEMLGQAEPPLTHEYCIYKVPSYLRKLNKDAYTPMVVSIGPFHHGNKTLQNMERHKIRFLKRFLERISPTICSEWIESIKELEPRIRLCYAETIELSRNELVKVIMVDAGFILELFFIYFYKQHIGWKDEDNILLKPWLTTAIRSDLLLLENQLPFFVLDTLFNQALIASQFMSNGLPSFLELTIYYFAHYNQQDIAPNPDMNIRHFTDLLRIFHLPPLERVLQYKKGEGAMTHLPKATELEKVGVKFKAVESKCLLDLQFSGRVLKVPCLKVEDWTETLFRNIMALEQCHYPNESYICDYIALLDFIISDAEDVDVLVKNGVIVNWLGDSNKVANLFNNLWKNITQTTFNSNYLELCKVLDKYYKNPCHNLKATLKRDYLNTPWQAAASFAGIILLLLTLIQTVCSILQV